jgi:Arm DNA-binding domain
MGQLNELQIKAAQPRDKEYLLADGEGLYLRIQPTGKAWVYRYKEAGKEAKLSLGRYPAMSLAVARKKARAEAEKRADGVDPREARREEGGA